VYDERADRALRRTGHRQKDLKACVRRPGLRAGRRASKVRTFATTTRGLLALSQWLAVEQVSLVGMVSTGDYWKPVF
jgi:hypothetical protein